MSRMTSHLNPSLKYFRSKHNIIVFTKVKRSRWFYSRHPIWIVHTKYETWNNLDLLIFQSHWLVVTFSVFLYSCAFAVLHVVGLISIFQNLLAMYFSAAFSPFILAIKDVFFVCVFFLLSCGLPACMSSLKIKILAMKIRIFMKYYIAWVAKLDNFNLVW